MSLIRKHGAVLQAWACLDLVTYYRIRASSFPSISIQNFHETLLQNNFTWRWSCSSKTATENFEVILFLVLFCVFLRLHCLQFLLLRC